MDGPATATESPEAARESGKDTRRRRLRVLAIAALVLLAAAELAGRHYGFHTPLIYVTTGYGYRVAPDQDFHRLGHHVRYNSFGLRNEEIAPMPAPGVLRILCVGDSVTNGGAIIDQEQTLGYELERLLKSRFGAVEVLNASAPGWAVANETGWLRENGAFGSQYVLLILSSHDLFQPLAPASIVDDYPEFPSRPPVLALQNIVHRYVLPRLFRQLHTRDPGAAGVVASDEEAERIRRDVQSLARSLGAQGARMVVVFLEQGEDLAAGAHTLGAKRSMFSMLRAEGVRVITLAEQVENLGREAIFRDNVHPSAAGNRIIAEAIGHHLGYHLNANSVTAARGRIEQGG